jgi:hypothetical protein
MDDLGMELDAVEPAVGRLEGGDRRGFRACDDAGAGRGRGDRVPMAHPDDLLLRQALEQLSLLRRVDDGLAELGHPCPLDAAAELLRHQLHAVADAQRRHAELE